MLRRPLAGVAAFVLLATSWLGAPLAHADPIDTSSQKEVAKAYTSQLVPALKVKPSWSGDVDKCRTGKPSSQPGAAVGSESTSARAATFAAVNYYRAMAGLKPVKENADSSARARQAALIMRANDDLSHTPGPSWTCYSAKGADAAGRSNIAISWGSSAGAGARSIQLYMDDRGSHNVEVGHRRWILNPEASAFGTGSTDRSNALLVVSGATDNANPRPKGGTAWPSAGFFPWETMPTSRRWSYALPALRGYDASLFDTAKVTVTLRGTKLKTRIVARGGYAGDPALVWETPKLSKPKAGATDVYTVTISGVKGRSKAITYKVKVFEARLPYPVASPKPTISGTAKVGKKLTAKAGTWKPGGTKLTYQWYRGSTKIVGATKSTYTLRRADKGKVITVKVKGTKKGYLTVTKTSAETAKVR
ncbi:MAG: CAP domain-containing protein [Arachnia sp.]